MADKTSKQQQELQLSKRLAKALEQLLETGDWESSLFLRTTKKRLETLKEQAQELSQELEGGESAESAAQAKRTELPLKAGHVKVYISLYQAEGNNLQLWQNLLKSLVHHSITRPVYQNEEHLRELIRSKPDPQRLAYVVVAVKEEDIIHFTKPTVDRFGHELLTLKEGGVQLENIVEFVHANKRRYLYQSNILTPFE